MSQIYVDNFGGYNKVYGSIAGVIVLMLWRYWSGMVLLLGGEINAEIEKSGDSAGSKESRAGSGLMRHSLPFVQTTDVAPVRSLCSRCSSSPTLMNYWRDNYRVGGKQGYPRLPPSSTPSSMPDLIMQRD